MEARLTSVDGAVELPEPSSDLRVHLALARWVLWERVPVGAVRLADLVASNTLISIRSSDASTP
jgi:hypothetical protein